MTLQIRPDIRWIAYPDLCRWVAQDPISNAYYYFSELEHDAARLLDGSRDLPNTAKLLNRRALKHPITVTWLEVLVERLHRSELLQPFHSGTGSNLRSPVRQGSFIVRIASNPLAIRIPLLRPSRHFAIAGILANLLFHPAVALIGAFLLAVTSFLVLATWLQRSDLWLYDISRLQGDRWLALFAMLLVIKSLHELGHYLATIRWKADCHEMGLLLLCFSPCLYCDTTDAWKLASKWQRAAIAAAGIYVELWIAVIGGLVFLNTEEGLWHTLGAGAFLTCTLGTLLINGNPCFRYDGYYILSDLWGVPNLSAQSNTALWESLTSLLGGRTPDPSRYDRPVWQLALFAFFAGMYRILVLGMLVLFLWSYLVPYGFGIVALFVLASIALGVSLMMFRTVQAMIAEFFGAKPIRVLRFLFFLALLGIAAWTAAAYPFPNNVSARGFAELKDGRPVFASDTSVLMSVGRLDEPLEGGELIFETDIPEKRIERLESQRQLAELRTRIRIREDSQVTDEASAYDLPTLHVLEREFESKLKILDRELEALRHEAPEAGHFVTRANLIPRPSKNGRTQSELGSVLDEEQVGMVLERGQLVGWFAPEFDYVVHAVVPEADARWLEIGMPAEAILDGQPHLRIPCTVRRISPEPVVEFPAELMEDRGLIGMRDETGRLRLESPHYLVVLEAKSKLPVAWRGSRVTVHFQLPGKTLLQTCIEFVDRSLRIQRPSLIP